MSKIIKEYNQLSSDIKGKVKLLNDLTGKEWVKLSKSIVTYSGPIV